MAPKKILTAIGLMSGTSFDGVDSAIIKTNGTKIYSLGETIASSYSDSLRRKIRNLVNKKNSIKLLLDVEDELALEHALIVKRLLQKAKMKPSDIDVIGFHGQTIYHNPSQRKTMQIGNSALLAESTGINVVSDFRRMDIASGGEGAPLVPFFHNALCQKLSKPVAVLNIGGVANVTYVGSNKELIAFDTGPGCAMIDDWVHDHRRGHYDDEGKIAHEGIPNQEVLDLFMRHKFFKQKPPKSLDRNKFKSFVKKLDGMSIEDGAATLTHLTALSIKNSQKFMPHKPKQWMVCGGGSKNRFLLDILSKQYGFKIINFDNFRVFDNNIIDAEFVEAQAFAFMAVRSLCNLPISSPTTTGVFRERSGGAFYRF